METRLFLTCSATAETNEVEREEIDAAFFRLYLSDAAHLPCFLVLPCQQPQNEHNLGFIRREETMSKNDVTVAVKRRERRGKTSSWDNNMGREYASHS